MLRRLSLFLWISLLWADSGNLLAPGSYDRALIGVDGDLVTGQFTDCTGECKFECNFFFEGIRKANHFGIAAYTPGETEVIRGRARSDGKKLNLRLESLPGGCWNVAPELKDAGTEMLLDAKGDWLQIRSLLRKSHLYTEPGGTRTIPLEARQTVIVLKKQNGWFYVRKPGAENAVGWLKVSDLVPLHNDPAAIPGKNKHN